jgi:uncharacterized RDD family membrane protein YckC
MSEQPPAGYGYGGAPPPPEVPGGEQPGQLLDRFLARLVDAIIVGIANSIFVSVLIVGVIMGGSAGLTGAASSWAAASVSAIISAAISLGYFAFLDSTRGQSVGKMLLKLKVVAPQGGNPSVEQSLRRNVFLAIGLIGIVPILGWFISPILSLIAVITIAVGINGDTVNRQGWHDQFAGGTRVVKLT